MSKFYLIFILITSIFGHNFIDYEDELFDAKLSNISSKKSSQLLEEMIQFIQNSFENIPEVLDFDSPVPIKLKTPKFNLNFQLSDLKIKGLKGFDIENIKMPTDSKIELDIIWGKMEGSDRVNITGHYILNGTFGEDLIGNHNGDILIGVKVIKAHVLIGYDNLKSSDENELENPMTIDIKDFSYRLKKFDGIMIGIKQVPRKLARVASQIASMLFIQLERDIHYELETALKDQISHILKNFK